MDHVPQTISPADTARFAAVMIPAAIRRQNEGRLTDAERLYRWVLALDAGNADCLHVLGGLAWARGDAVAARRLIRRAIATDPTAATFHANLAAILHQSGVGAKGRAEGRAEGKADAPADGQAAAIGSWRRAAALEPGQADVHQALADALALTAPRTGAARAALRALRLRPDSAEAAFLLGRLLHQDRRQVDRGHAGETSGRAVPGRIAIAAFRRAIEIEPAAAGAWINLGTAATPARTRTGGPVAVDGGTACRRGVLLNPTLAEAHTFLADALGKTGEMADVLRARHRAIALKPDGAGLYAALARDLERGEQVQPASLANRRAVTLAPDEVSAWISLGLRLDTLGRFGQAQAALAHALVIAPAQAHALIIAANTAKKRHHAGVAEIFYRRALALTPTSGLIRSSLGELLSPQGRIAEAIGWFRSALVLAPAMEVAHNNLGDTLRAQGDIAGAVRHIRRALAIKPGDHAIRSDLQFTLTYQDVLPLDQAVEHARTYGRMVEALAAPFTRWSCPPNPPVLRVGLVSADIREHPVGFFLDRLVPHLDPEQIQLVGYPTTFESDGLTRRLRAHFQDWAPIAGLSDAAAAARIHGDGINILFDLAGHTAGNRLTVFARRPAPVQVTWAGYSATTGLTRMDYLLADARAVPETQAWQFTERIWRMPEAYVCFSPPDPDVPLAPPPALGNGYVTFGSLNNLSKINEAVVRTWALVLHAVPNAHLFLKTHQLGDATVRERVASRFAALGIAPDRLIMEGPADRLGLMAAYNHIDIGLDPFPYAGGITTLEAMWMGVPVLTAKGDRFLSNVGESFAHWAGLDDWIAADQDAMIALAAAKTADPAGLSAVRARLRDTMRASPLLDGRRFARHLTQALQGMWREREGTF